MAHSKRGVSLTQVHPPLDADAETDIDIIAIHGLDTKSPDTWTWSKYPDEDVNWLASPQMLQASIGPARIFTCDWPADLFEQPDLVQKTIEEFALLLLDGIKRRPVPATSRARGTDRPILFIASCLGGIILIKALLTADHPPSEYTAIRRATHGIVFLATPFRGTSFQVVASWAEMGLKAWASVRHQKVSKLLDSVKGSTFDLEQLVRRFTQLCQSRDYPCHVFTFYEMGVTNLRRKLPLESLVNSLRVVPSSQPKPLVDRSSATLDIVPHPLPLDRPHKTMNKFYGPEDPAYKCVVGKIEEILQLLRTNRLLDEADACIRNNHYTRERLEIKRLSGKPLQMDQCYINLAIVERSGQDVDRLGEAATTSSTFLLFPRQKVETPDETIQVELPTIFRQRKGGNGQSILPRRILIRGRAGVGKTTLCKKIVYDFTHGTQTELHRSWVELFDRLLWVPLRNLKGRSKAGYNYENLFYDEYFSGQGYEHGRRLASELWWTLKDANSCRTLFILDGLDEIIHDLSRVGNMSEFLADLVNQRNVIVTSRPHSVLPGLRNLDLELETIGFYPDQVKAYLEAEAKRNPGANKIQSFLQDHWLLQGLVRIPIQLDALCYIWEDFKPGTELDTMTGIYTAITQRLLMKDVVRLEKKHDGEPVTLSQITTSDVEYLAKDEIYFLEGLAFTGLHNDMIDFTAEHRDAISKQFRRPGMLSEKTLPQLSFLRTSDPSKGRKSQYHFLHLTFQEYFAARYFVRQWKAQRPLECLELGSRRLDQTEPASLVRKHKYTARYDILWRFVAGLLDEIGQASSLLEIIEMEPLDLLGPTHQRLVMHCFGEISSVLPTRTDVSRRLSMWLLFEWKFGRSAHLASEVEFPEQALDTAFREGPGGMKKAILQSVTKRATIPHSIIEQAVSSLEHLDRDVQQAAVSAFGGQSTFPNEILEAVAKLLGHKATPVRRAAANALRGRSVLPIEVLSLVEAWFDHKDTSVRVAAVEALQLKSALPIETLKAVAARLEDGDWQVRNAAGVAFRDQSAVPDKALEAVAERLKHKNKEVQCAAIYALGRRSGMPDEILEVVVDRLKHKKKDILCAAVDLGGRLGMPDDILEAVAALLLDKDEDIRLAAVRALGRRSTLPSKILTSLAARLENEDEKARVQWAAIDTLGGQLALPDKIFEALVAQLKHKDRIFRWTAAQALCKRSSLPDYHFQIMAGLLEDQDEDIRRFASIALGRRSDLSSDTLLRIAAQLEDQHLDVRRAAAKALDRQQDLGIEILRAVSARLKHKDGDVRWTAAQALRGRPTLPHEILQAVSARLKDQIWQVRANAEAVLRRHHEFYLTLLNGPHVTSLYGILLRRSLEEQVTWYIEDGYSCVNMPEGIRRVPISNQHDFVRAIVDARPANFPSTSGSSIWPGSTPPLPRYEMRPRKLARSSSNGALLGKGQTKLSSGTEKRSRLSHQESTSSKEQSCSKRARTSRPSSRIPPPE